MSTQDSLEEAERAGPALRWGSVSRSHSLQG
jgi:hypothetical protein